MGDRRPLIDGLKSKPDLEPSIEREFVYQEPQSSSSASVTVQSFPTKAGGPVARSPFSTRIRTDFANAVKRASLERQLQGIEPNSIQDILEEALASWLERHGYLT